MQLSRLFYHKALHFPKNWGETTGIYAFNPRYNVSTIIRPAFQKTMDDLLPKSKNTLTFIDEIFMVTKGSKEEHMNKMEEAIKVMNDTVIRLMQI